MQCQTADQNNRVIVSIKVELLYTYTHWQR